MARTDKIRPIHLLSSQSDDDGGRIRQRYLPDDGGPAREGRALQMKEQEGTLKEAFNGTAFAQFLFGPGGRQAEAILLPLGVEGE